MTRPSSWRRHFRLRWAVAGCVIATTGLIIVVFPASALLLEKVKNALGGGLLGVGITVVFEEFLRIEDSRRFAALLGPQMARNCAAFVLGFNWPVVGQNISKKREAEVARYAEGLGLATNVRHVLQNRNLQNDDSAIPVSQLLATQISQQSSKCFIAGTQLAILLALAMLQIEHGTEVSTRMPEEKWRTLTEQLMGGVDVILEDRDVSKATRAMLTLWWEGKYSAEQAQVVLNLLWYRLVNAQRDAAELSDMDRVLRRGSLMRRGRWFRRAKDLEQKIEKMSWHGF